MTTIVAGTVEVFVLRMRGGHVQVLVMRRAQGTRCTGAWEVVHGRIDEGEKPEEAAVREVREETALTVSRLYNVTCHMFYLHPVDTVQVAVVFGAFVEKSDDTVLGTEHDAAEWVSADQGMARLTWPKSRATLNDVVDLLRTGDAGPVDDVLRVF